MSRIDSGRLPESLIGARIFAMCSKKDCGVDEIVRSIYRKYDMYAVGKIYRIIRDMCKEGILAPTFHNRLLKYKADNGFMEKK